MTWPFAEAVTQHSRSRGASDSDGNETWDDVNIPRAGALYPTPVSELVQGQDLTVIRLTAVFKPSIPVLATDEFTARGKRWAVDGFPGQYDSPFTGHTVTQIHLVRAEG